MILRKWEDLPDYMQVDEVKKYYDVLNKKKYSLVIKRVFDVVVSLFLVMVCCPLYLLLAILIKLDSPGPVFYRQERVTQYGKHFKIHKFRTMICDADKSSRLTVANDRRIMKTGKYMRKFKVDELSQFIDVLKGDMTFVGTRPEVPEFVEKYTPEMMATLLLPAGITSRASIYYKDENKLLDKSQNPEKTYVEVILPDKMKHNLRDIENFSFRDELKILFLTVFSVLIK